MCEHEVRVKTRSVYYYCTCSENPDKKAAVSNGRTKFRKVLTNSEGICNNCGYYAVSTRGEVDLDKGNLYKFLIGYKTESEIRQARENYYKDRTNSDSRYEQRERNRWKVCR